MFFVLEYFL